MGLGKSIKKACHKVKNGVSKISHNTKKCIKHVARSAGNIFNITNKFSGRIMPTCQVNSIFNYDYQISTYNKQILINNLLNRNLREGYYS